ncbi:hypothetical protein M0R45_032346 [Rubus argutus]|uniref:Retrotransposon Copia-like N-terminal domain-containing protein n=1 Tax=Rubus argutus TaxID=59490 RepID=A0AAW1WIS3_RUBAR
MADASEISQPPVDPLRMASHVSVKLTRANYFLWKSELVPVLKTYDLFNIVQGKEQCPAKYMSADKKDKNPAYTNWKRRDRACRVFIYATLSEDMWPLLWSCSRRAREVWLKLEEEFLEITRPRIRHLKSRLLDLKKGKLTIVKYLELAEEIADGLEVAGCPLEDWDFAAHVLHGLPWDYDDFATSIRAGDSSVTREELRSLLVSEEIVLYKRRQVAARIMPNAASNTSPTVQQRSRPKPPVVPRFTEMPENRKHRPKPPLVLRFPQMTENREHYGVTVKEGFTLMAGCALVYAFVLEPFLIH